MRSSSGGSSARFAHRLWGERSVHWRSPFARGGNWATRVGAASVWGKVGHVRIKGSNNVNQPNPGSLANRAASAKLSTDVSIQHKGTMPTFAWKKWCRWDALPPPHTPLTHPRGNGSGEQIFYDRISVLEHVRVGMLEC